MLPTTLPEPPLFLPGQGEPALRWGVLAPGRIAGAFAHAVHTHTRQRIVAVGSRSLDRAQAFATQHGIERTESPLHTLAETVSILATIDEARRQLGCADDPA